MKCGAIAQLGARLHGMQKVRGSTPLGSIRRKSRFRRRLRRNLSEDSAVATESAPGRTTRRTDWEAPAVSNNKLSTQALIPPLRVHKGSGQAYVNLCGARRYLGKADSPEVKRRSLGPRITHSLRPHLPEFRPHIPRCCVEMKLAESPREKELFYDPTRGKLLVAGRQPPKAIRNFDASLKSTSSSPSASKFCEQLDAGV